MRRDTRRKVVWASWMTGGAIAAALVAWVLTDSPGWAIVALVAAGPVLNALAQMVVQPARAVKNAKGSGDRGETAR